MKKQIFLLAISLFAIFHQNIAQNRYWIATTASNWNNSANWSASSGGVGGASIPGAGNMVFFDGNGQGNCLLDVAPTIAGISISGYNSDVDLSGFALTTTGTNTFASGNIINSGGAASLVLNTTGTTTFSGTTINTDVTGTTGRIFFNGSHFGGTVTIAKTGTNTDDGTGSNTFNGALSLTINSTGAIRMGTVNPDIFNTNVTLILNGNGGDISLARSSAGNQFNGNITVDYQTLGDAAVGFAGGTSTLASGQVITTICGASGCDDLTLSGLTQLGAATAQNITLSGNNTAVLTLGPASEFNGTFTGSAPSLMLETCTFRNTTQLTKTGTAANALGGGNIFDAITTINNQGGDLIFGSNPAHAGDTWNADVTFNNTGGNRIRIGEETAGNIFNANATFNCLGATDVANRIQISRLAGGETTFNGTTTFLANGTGADIHISYDAGTTTTFNGPVIYTSSTAGNENYFGYDGTVVFASDLELNSTVSSSIYFGYNNGAVTFGNGAMSIGATGFATGQIRFQNFTQTGATAQSLTLTGTATLRFGASATFFGDVDFRAPQVYLDGATFNGAAHIEKTGASDNNGVGGDIFNGVTTIVNSGTGSFELGNTNPETFDDDVTITNTGTNRIQIGLDAAGNLFNGDVTINHGGNNGFSTNTIIARNAGSTATFNGNLILNCTNASTASGIIIGNDGDVTINGNVTVSSTSGRGVLFANASGAVTLADGFSITASAGTFTTGSLSLKSFTQLGNTAQNITLAGTADLITGPASTFNGNVSFITPQIHLDGCTFNSTTYLEKTGATDNTGDGDNIFNGVTTIVNSGSGDFISGDTSNDIFNNDLTLTNTGTQEIQMAENSAGNVFNGNITVNCTSGNGIYFGNSGSATVTLATGKTLSVGGLGFSAGQLALRRFTQLGNGAQNLTLTGTAILAIGPASTFNGNVTFIAPRFDMDGCTYEGTTYIEKTGASNDDGDGGNTFNGVTTIANSGSGYLRSGVTTLDNFNNDLTLTSTGGSIRLADNIPGTVFNGNITVNCVAGNGIYFANNTAGSATLATGRTITIGGLGFNSGELRLLRFTQVGNTAQNLNLTGTALLRLGPSSTFNGNVNFVASRVLLHGATYNGTAFIEKNGATDDAGNGGNTFNGATTLVNSSSHYFMTGSTTADTFNDQVTLTNTGSDILYIAHSSAGTVFNGNILVNCTAGTGILFSNNAAGSSTLAAGRTITVGGIGFTAGELRLRRFTQAGATAQNIALTGSSTFRIGVGATFNGATTISAPSVYLDGGTFLGAANITKTGNANNDNVGGNTFGGATTITNSGAGRLRLSNGAGDVYNGNVTFVRNSGTFEPAYAQTNTFSGDITITSTTALTFGTGGGTVELTGTNAQSIAKTGGSASPIIQRLTMNKGANTATLNTDLTIGTTATFTSGVLNSSTGNYLNFANNATTTGANNSSYVDGPVRKTGDDAFTFPVGDNGFYRSIGMSAPTNIAHHFTAQYFNTGQTFGGVATWDPSFWTVNGCEYWTLDRTNGTSNVAVTLSWNETACGSPPGYITNPPDLRVTRWNGTAWVDHGNGGTTGSNASGTITSASAITSFSPFTIASTTGLNPLPIELKRFWASDIGTTVTINWITATEHNNDYFTLQRSANGIDFENLTHVKSKGDSKIDMRYAFVDEAPYAGISYYRLKQTDIDGASETFQVIAVQRGSNQPFTVHPNPGGNEQIEVSEKGNIAVFNNLNQLVAEFSGIASFDATTLAPGVYVIKNQKGQMVRFVKK